MAQLVEYCTSIAEVMGLNPSQAGILFRRKFHNCLRATACIRKYGESDDRSDHSDFLLLRQKDPFGELFSEIYFQSSSEFTFL